MLTSRVDAGHYLSNNKTNVDTGTPTVASFFHLQDQQLRVLLNDPFFISGLRRDKQSFPCLKKNIYIGQNHVHVFLIYDNE